MRQLEFSGLETLNKIVKKEKAQKIFVVSGKNSFQKSGAKKKIDSVFKKNKIKAKMFSSFSPNPKISEIHLGLEKFKEEKYDLLIGIGGGSSIDVAKLIKLFSKRNIPLIAIPTTAGSGSESTYFAVYYIKKEKQSEGNPKITLPDYFILDYALLKSLPPKIMASSGMDALGQAIESYWSINSTKTSKEYAKKAIKLMIDNLEKAVKSYKRKHLKKIQKGANLAGKAINITKTTACHSLAYPMTSYFGIPHGHAVGMTLGEMLKFNYSIKSEDCLDNRGPAFVRKSIGEIIRFIGVKNPPEASKKINLLMKGIGLKTKLSEFGLEKSDLNIILKNGFNPQRVKNNPRKLTMEQARNILEKV